MTEPTQFDEELPGLLTEILRILPDGDSDKIHEVLNRLMNYEGLDEVQQNIVQNFKDALELRHLLAKELPSVQYLTDVTVESPLDRGGFGEVYEGKWKENRVAVKKFCHVNPPERIQGLGPYKDKFIHRVEQSAAFTREVEEWARVSTLPYVWPLWGFTMLADQRREIIVFALVSPLAEGNLKLDYNDWRALTPKMFASYFNDVATGLQNIHDHDTIHGDIRPENILQYEGHCYLVDFGISKFLYSSSSFTFMPALANADFIPERIDGSVTHRNKETDIFSFGSSMYRVLVWHEETLDNAPGHPERPESRLAEEWDDIWNLIPSCMSNDPASRPTALQLVKEFKAILDAFLDEAEVS